MTQPNLAPPPPASEGEPVRGNWTEERVALAVRLREEGWSASQIAARLGNVTRNGVIGQLYRNATPTPEWPEDRTERLKQLRLEGLSCGEIAAALGGVTRNAVLTKLSRMGIPAPEKRQASAPTLRPRVISAPVTPLPVRSLPAPMPVERAPDGGVRLLDRLFRQCAFPLGENARGEAMCCGAPGQPYCPDHRRIMYAPTRAVNPRYLDKSTRRRTSRDQDEDLPNALDGKVA